MEKWKDIKGYEGLYQVSDQGRVKSFVRRKEGKILKLQTTYKGYLSVKVGGKRVAVHRKVAKAFIPNLDNKPQVNHIDGIKTNNNVDNLEWCTNSENQIHANKLGLRRTPKGEEVYNSIPVLQYDMKGNFIKRWGSQTTASEELKISHSQINACCLKKRHYKSAGGFIWKKEKE